MVVNIGGPGSMDLRRRLRNEFPNLSDEQLDELVQRFAPAASTPKSKYYDELGEYHSAKRSANPLPHPKAPGAVENIQMASKPMRTSPRMIEDLRADPAGRRAPLISSGGGKARPLEDRTTKLWKSGGTAFNPGFNSPVGFFSDGTPVRDRLPRAPGAASGLDLGQKDIEEMPGSRPYRMKVAFQDLARIRGAFSQEEPEYIGGTEGIPNIYDQVKRLQTVEGGHVRLRPMPSMRLKVINEVARTSPDSLEFLLPGASPVEFVDHLMQTQVSEGALDLQAVVAGADINLKQRESDRLDQEITFRREEFEQQKRYQEWQMGGNMRPEPKQVLDIEKLLNEMDMNGQLDASDDMVAQAMDDPSFEGMSSDGVRQALKIQARGMKERQLYGRLGMGPSGGGGGPGAEEAPAPEALAPSPSSVPREGDILGQQIAGVASNQEAGAPQPVRLGDKEETAYSFVDDDYRDLEAILGDGADPEEISKWQKDPVGVSRRKLPKDQFNAWLSEFVERRVETETPDQWNAIVKLLTEGGLMKQSRVNELRDQISKDLRKKLGLNSANLTKGYSSNPYFGGMSGRVKKVLNEVEMMELILSKMIEALQVGG